MKDYKELSKEEKRKISDHIQKVHKNHIEKMDDLIEGVSSFMNNFYERLIKDDIIAEKFIMDRKVFNNEIAKSLSKIYSIQLEDKINSLTNPELTSDSQPNSNSLTKEDIAAIEDFFKEKATPDQIKILVAKQKKKKANANHYANPKNKEILKQKALDYHATTKGKEIKRQARIRYRSTEKGREAHRRLEAARRSSNPPKNGEMLLKRQPSLPTQQKISFLNLPK